MSAIQGLLLLQAQTHKPRWKIYPSITDSTRVVAAVNERVGFVKKNCSSPWKKEELRSCRIRPVLLHALITKEEDVEEEEEEVVVGGGVVDARAVITIRRKMKEGFFEQFKERLEMFQTGIGLGVLLQLVSNRLDPETKVGRRSAEVAAMGLLPKHLSQPHIVEYTADFRLDPEFGSPGAVVVTNLHQNEFFLVEITIHGFGDGPIIFHANSWVHSQKDNPDKRFFFSNHAYLPSQTPPGLNDLRHSDMITIRGNGKRERKTFERIYDYAPYNDLGNPDKAYELSRPVLGGDELPYPRRCRTGRPPSKTDLLSESRIEKPNPVYVPRDENFEETKQRTFSSGRLKALTHNLIPALSAALARHDSSFECFSQIDKLYRDGISVNHDDHGKPPPSWKFSTIINKVLNEGKQLIKYDMPSIISKDRFAWLRDNEFARQTLAGVNPVNIQRVKDFPILSELDPAVYGSPESAITKECIEKELDGLNVDKAIEENRLFLLDYHDMLLPFIDKMNSIEGREAYASRTIFFLTKFGMLKPIAIELSLPPTPSESRNKHVYTPGHEATSFWTWKLAKAHVASNDAGIHQLVNHFLRTHACMEPYVIATHRQLSAMHPIYKLLHPHLRYTLEINALARQSLINGGGVIESCFSPGKYSMELSAAAYKSFWRFDMEALPADLIRRGMAVEDPSSKTGVKLIIDDYPYAADGLLIWSAIKEWVHDYVSKFYSDPASVRTDTELQNWWREIKYKGHHDKRNEPWWPKMKTVEDLCGILTTMIWVASGLHAALNFGQYPYGGYMPNRPTLIRKLMPQEDESDYENFILNPQSVYLSSLPSLLQATKVMAVKDTLSTHSPDEEYLGEMQQYNMHWTSDQKVLSAFQKFSKRLDEIEDKIHARNKDPRLKNRCGAGVPPYELFIPVSKPGVTGRGIPNSISI